MLKCFAEEINSTGKGQIKVIKNRFAGTLKKWFIVFELLSGRESCRF